MSRKSPYGKKGGTSRNAGKKATSYIIVFPDGTTTIKKSFCVNAPLARAGIYYHGGIWHVARIYPDDVPIPQSQTTIVVVKFNE